MTGAIIAFGLLAWMAGNALVAAILIRRAIRQRAFSTPSHGGVRR